MMKVTLVMSRKVMMTTMKKLTTMTVMMTVIAAVPHQES